MELNFILENWKAVVAIILGPIISFFAGKTQQEAQIQRAQAENKNAEIGNVENIIEVYQKSLDDLKVRFEERVLELTADVERMNTLNAELRKAVSSQEKYIKKLKNKLAEYEGLGT